MHPAYFQTRFKTEHPFASWPAHFVIITAFATTGEQWTDAENAAADHELERVLRARSLDIRRVVGYSPTTGHEEQGWSCELALNDACAIGRDFRQDALYVVTNGLLSVTYCDARRALVPVAQFLDRLDA